jgi:hypothetical protein
MVVTFNLLGSQSSSLEITVSSGRLVTIDSLTASAPQVWVAIGNY